MKKGRYPMGGTIQEWMEKRDREAQARQARLAKSQAHIDAEYREAKAELDSLRWTWSEWAATAMMVLLVGWGVSALWRWMS